MVSVRLAQIKRHTTPYFPVRFSDVIHVTNGKVLKKLKLSKYPELTVTKCYTLWNLNIFHSFQRKGIFHKRFSLPKLSNFYQIRGKNNILGRTGKVFDSFRRTFSFFLL